MKLPNIIQDRKVDVLIYFPTKIKGEKYDQEESNYDYRLLPPKNIKAYISNTVGMQRTLEEYGLRDKDILKLLIEGRYRKYFELAGKIIIEEKEYNTYREGVGNNVIITELPNNFITVILQGV